MQSGTDSVVPTELALKEIPTEENISSQLSENSLTPENIQQITLLAGWPVDQHSALALSNNGEFLALAELNKIYLYESKTLKFIMDFKSRQTVTQLTFSTDDNYLAAGTAGNEIYLWQLNFDFQETILRLPDGYLNINSLTFSPSSELLAAAVIYKENSEDNYVHIWRVRDGQYIASFDHRRINKGYESENSFPDYLSDWYIFFSEDGQNLIGSASENTLKQWVISWDSGNQSIKSTINWETNQPVYRLFLKKENQLLSINKSGFLQIIDLLNGDIYSSKTLEIPDNSKFVINWNNENPVMILSSDGMVQKISLNGEEKNKQILINGLKGETLLCVNNDKLGVYDRSGKLLWIDINDLSNQKELEISITPTNPDLQINAEPNSIRGKEFNQASIAFTLEGKPYIAFSSLEEVILWGYETTKINNALQSEEFTGYIDDAVIDSSGKKLFLVNNSQKVSSWDIQTGIKENEIISEQHFYNLVVSPDEKNVVGENCNFLILNLFTQREDILDCCNSFGTSFSADGEFLSTVFLNLSLGGPEINEINVWQKNSENEWHLYHREELGCDSRTEFFCQNYTAISSDHKYFAALDECGKLIVWDLQTREKIFSQEILQERPLSMVFTPDSDLLAVMTFRSLKFFQFPEIQLIYSIEQPFLNFADMRFSHDGSILGAVFLDGKVLLWGIPK